MISHSSTNRGVPSICGRISIYINYIIPIIPVLDELDIDERLLPLRLALVEEPLKDELIDLALLFVLPLCVLLHSFDVLLHVLEVDVLPPVGVMGFLLLLLLHLVLVLPQDVHEAFLLLIGAVLIIVTYEVGTGLDSVLPLLL